MLLVAALIVFLPVYAVAQSAGVVTPVFSGAKSGEKVWRYQPSQINPPIPKYEYTDEGRVIMIKRYPRYSQQDICQFTRYRFYENKNGVEHCQQGWKFKREPDEILSEQQKAILREWGQPDYLRGPYKSTRGDSVIEWAYHPMNHLFQFVDRAMVYEGPLTDQERTAITFGAPKQAVIYKVGPNIRRETWFYYPWLGSQVGNEKIFSFSNGQLIYSQESP